MEHPFGNFSSILKSKKTWKIYISGGKQRKKLFELNETDNKLIEKCEMYHGRSNHSFVEASLYSELLAIGGWDGEKSMN